MSAWDVRYARQFAEQLAELPDATYDRVDGSVDILAPNPDLARWYDPQYEAARPPVPCRSYPVPRTTKVIYLVKDEERRELTMLFLGGRARGPEAALRAHGVVEACVSQGMGQLGLSHRPDVFSSVREV